MMLLSYFFQGGMIRMNYFKIFKKLHRIFGESNRIEFI